MLQDSYTESVPIVSKLEVSKLSRMYCAVCTQGEQPQLPVASQAVSTTCLVSTSDHPYVDCLLNAFHVRFLKNA